MEEAWVKSLRNLTDTRGWPDVRDVRHLVLQVPHELEYNAGDVALVYPRNRPAVTNALLGKDPDVDVLRGRIGADIRARLVAALGAAVDPDVIEALELLYTGTLVWAGMGYEAYPEISLRLLKSARLILR